MFDVHGFRLVKASVSGYGQAPKGMSVAGFKERAIEKHGRFLLTKATIDDDGLDAGRSVGPPGPLALADAITASDGYAAENVVADLLPPCVALPG
jgi:hypothetical protein